MFSKIYELSIQKLVNGKLLKLINIHLIIFYSHKWCDCSTYMIGITEIIWDKNSFKCWSWKVRFWHSVCDRYRQKYEIHVNTMWCLLGRDRKIENEMWHSTSTEIKPLWVEFPLFDWNKLVIKNPYSIGNPSVLPFAK